jgi:hypothetical protein
VSDSPDAKEWREKCERSPSRFCGKLLYETGDHSVGAACELRRNGQEILSCFEEELVGCHTERR